MKLIKKIAKWSGIISASFVALIILLIIAMELATWYAHDFALDYRQRDECLDTGSLNGDIEPCRAFGMKFPEENQ